MDWNYSKVNKNDLKGQKFLLKGRKFEKERKFVKAIKFYSKSLQYFVSPRGKLSALNMRANSLIELGRY